MNFSFFSSCAQGSSCIRPITTDQGAGLKVVGIMNVYCSFVSLSLSACFHPLGIVCVKEHYSLFYGCLTHPLTRTHAPHTNTVELGGGIKGSLAHTTLMESRCREWAALLKLRWRSVSAKSMFRRRSQMLPGKKHAERRPTTTSEIAQLRLTVWAVMT